MKRIILTSHPVDHLYHERFMRVALKQGKKVKEGRLPAGAVVVWNGEIIGEGRARDRCLRKTTAHAEILAIEMANKERRNHRLEDCIIYCTHEPCQMCASAIFQAGIQEIVIGIPRFKMNVREHDIKLEDLVKDCGYHVNITYEILADEILKLTEERGWVKKQGTHPVIAEIESRYA